MNGVFGLVYAEFDRQALSSNEKIADDISNVTFVVFFIKREENPKLDCCDSHDPRKQSKFPTLQLVIEHPSNFHRRNRTERVACADP